MSFKDKFKSFIGIDEEEFFDDVDFPEMEPAQFNMPSNVITSQPSPKQQSPKQQQRATSEVSRMQNSKAALLNKVIIREPKNYADAQDIADCLKQNLPVFVNLQRVDDGEGRRIIDFLSGTIYAVDGEIKRVGNELFLCTPKHVETEGGISSDAPKDDLGLH